MSVPQLDGDRRAAVVAERVDSDVVAHHGVDSRGRRAVFAIPAFSQPNVRFIAELMESGAFRPVIRSRHPLDLPLLIRAVYFVLVGRWLGGLWMLVSWFISLPIITLSSTAPR